MGKELLVVHGIFLLLHIFQTPFSESPWCALHDIRIGQTLSTPEAGASPFQWLNQTAE